MQTQRPLLGWCPGQIILRLEPQADLALAKTAEGPEIDKLQLPTALQSLDSEYGIASIRPLFVSSATRRANGAETHALRGIYVLTFETPDVDVEEVARQCANREDVDFAEPNYLLQPLFVPNDPFFSSSNRWGQGFADQWGLKLAQLSNAWDLVSETNEIVVAMVDSGVDLRHADMAANLWSNLGEIPSNGVDDDANGFVDDANGWDFVNRDSDPTDDQGHGTIGAGVVAGVLNNGVGMAGIGKHTKIMALKFLPALGGGATADAVEAITYAANNGAHVVNLSFGGNTDTRTLKTAIDYAYNAGLVLFAAAGNDSIDATRCYPANYRNVIAVGASDPLDRLTDFSNFGVRIDVVAPGGSSGGSGIGNTVVSLRAAGTTSGTPLDAEYTRNRGTSFASPFAAGVAALMLTQRPSLSNEEIRQILRVTAKDVVDPGWDLHTAYGRVDAYRALQRESALCALLRSPENHQFVGGTVTVQGSAHGANFAYYLLECGSGETPSSWTLVSSSSVAVASGNLASWDTTTRAEGIHTLRLRVVDRLGENYVDRIIVSVNNNDPPDHEGWPMLGGDSAPMMTDLDGDGLMEILWGSKTKMTVRNQRGGVFAGWPQSVPFSLPGIPSVADLDGDGDVEIGLMSGNITTRSNAISIWHHDGTPLPGWPKVQVSGNPFVSRDESVAFADIDRDGQKDIVYFSGTAQFGGSGILHVDRLDGTPCAGWPVTLSGEGLYGSPAVGDVDGDGFLDIAVRTFSNKVHLYRHNGTRATGWPKSLSSGNSMSGGPGLADVNHDGLLEVVADTRDGNVYVFKANGAAVPGWPQNAGYIARGPAFADLDGDGDLEIAFGSQDGLLSVWHHNGTAVSGWPQTVPSRIHCPVIADLNGDSRLDILSTDGAQTVHAWDREGRVLREMGFPISMGESLGCYSGASSGDVDGDGLVEILVTCNTQVYLWDLASTNNPSFRPFPQLRQSDSHESRYAPPPLVRTTGPAFAEMDSPPVLTIAGDHFLKGMKVYLNTQPQTVVAESATSIAVNVSASLPPGWYDLTVTNVNSTSYTLPHAFVVVSTLGGDDDADGLRNVWEIQHQFDPHDDGRINPDSGAHGDPDGDGYENWQERIAGTNPRDASSLFQIVAVQAREKSAIVIQWPTVTNRQYSVFRSTNLLDPSSQLTNGMPAFAPLNTFTDDAVLGAASFYFIQADSELE